MKTYPHIEGSNKAPHKPCIAFYKYDGSNLRWEWNKKRGWYKHGTRTRLFDHTDEDFGEAIPIFYNELAYSIEKVIVDKFRHIERAIVYTEFLGENSFAGSHSLEEPKQLVLIDVALYKQGIMNPWDFVKYFSNVRNVAEIIYEGNLNQQFIEDIRESRYPVWEGVVCKGGGNHSNLWMRKIKTYAYLEKLKEIFANGWEKYWE